MIFVVDEAIKHHVSRFDPDSAMAFSIDSISPISSGKHLLGNG
jgi:hypothetical protein